MIHPSYTELIAKINSEVEEGEQPVIQSRYSLVKAAANRAKQIIDARAIEERSAKNPDKDKLGEEVMNKEDRKKVRLGTPLIANSDSMKPLSIAVEELYEGKVKIVGSSDDENVDKF